MHFANKGSRGLNVEDLLLPRVIVWYSTLVVERQPSNPILALVKFKAVNEPRNTGSWPFCKTPVNLENLLSVHVFLLSSNSSRWVNSFKNARTFQSKEHSESLSLRTVSPRGPKHALSGVPQKTVNDIPERVRELRLTNAEKWVLAWMRADSKSPDIAREGEELRLREVT